MIKEERRDPDVTGGKCGCKDMRQKYLYIFLAQLPLILLYSMTQAAHFTAQLPKYSFKGPGHIDIW